VIEERPEDHPDLLKLKNDLVDNLKGLLTNRGLSSFEVIAYPNYYAKKITDADTALKYLQKSKATFLAYGKSKIRKVDGIDAYVLDMDAIVIHRLLPTDVQNALANEFAELFPRKTLINKANELLGFEITAQLVEAAAKYIIGIALFLSYEFDYSIDLFNSLKNDLIALQAVKQALSIKKIRDRIPRRLTEVYSAKANMALAKFLKNKTPENLEQMKALLDKIESYDINNYEAILKRSIYYFYKIDIAKAKSEISKCKKLKIKDGTWMFSEAFLLAYQGNIKGAHAAYQRAFKAKAQTNIIEIEQFIEDVLAKEPNKHQLHFALGLINQHEKNDSKTAVYHFAKYIEQETANDYGLAIATSHLQSMEAQLQSASARE
jgi:hypothetical protein